MRYLAIHLLGGVLLFAGVAGHVAATGSTEFARMTLESPAHWLILAGFLVNAGAPPLSKPLRAYATARRRAPLDYALGGGEDFELLITLPPRFLSRAQRLAAKDVPLTVIGRITPARRGLVVIDAAGRRHPLPRVGYEHFRSGG